MLLWTDPTEVLDRTLEDEIEALKWQQDRSDELSAAAGRQYGIRDAEREANGTATGLVNALGMVAVIGMGIVFLLTVLWVCGAPWAGVW